MLILIDMDNVVASLYKKWLHIYNIEYNDNITSDQITKWHIESHIPKCSAKQFYDIIERVGFFSDLEVIPYSIEVTRRLQQVGHELYFVTATPYDNPTGGFDKQNWVEKYFPHIGRSRVIQTHHKFMVRGDLLIDDAPVNLQSFNGIKVIMDMPHNKDYNADYRVMDWLQFEHIISRIK